MVLSLPFPEGSTVKIRMKTATVRKNWEVLMLDPRSVSPCFANNHLDPEYASYDPPHGFTGEQIMQFDGAKDVFESIDEVEKLIELRDRLGALQGRVDSNSD